MARVMESEAGILDLAGTIEHGSPHEIVVIAQQLGMKPGQQTLVRASGRRYGKP